MFLFLSKTYAQQNIQYTQYMYDLSLINPAYAGAYGALNISLIHRDQWNGLEGAPQAQTLSAHTLFKKQQIGTGILVHRETIGVHQNLHAAANIAYHLELNKGQTLSLGLNAGVFNTQSDYQSLQAGVNDPTAYDEAFTGTDFNAGFGLYYRADKLELSYSVPTLLTRDVYINDSTTIDPTALNHLFFSRYTFGINDNLKLQPSFLIKYYPNLPVSYDLNMIFNYKDLLSTGLSYRAQESVDLLLRLQITPQLQIGYAFDYPIGNVNRLSQASNELMLRYLFKFSYGKVKSSR